MPLLWLSLAFLLGVLLGEYLNLPSASWIVIAVVWLFIFIGKTYLKRRGYLVYPNRLSRIIKLPASLPSIPIPIPLLCVVIAIGAFRMQSSKHIPGPEFIDYYNDTGMEYTIDGIVVKPPDVRDSYTGLRLEVTQIHPVSAPPFKPVSGQILAWVAPGDTWSYGDQALLEGELLTPPDDEDFSYRSYLARKGIYSYLPDTQIELVAHNQGNPALSLIYQLREHALGTIYTFFPDPEASLLAGILVGVESGIPDDVEEAFRDTGTSHVIAISGFNITIIAGLLAAIFGRMIGHGRKGARWGALIALVGIILYAIMVGGDAAVVRAAIMGGLTLLALQLGRRQDGVNSLALVAALMALFTPYVLWDVGFQLSFAATLGLILLAKPMTDVFINLVSRRIPVETARRVSGPFGEYILFTIAASIFTLPVILYHFQRLSLVSLIANPLILPVQPPIMILGGLAVIVGLVYQPLGQLIAYLAWPFLAYTIRVVETLAEVPGSAITIGEVSLFAVVLFYIIILIWILAGSRIRDWLASRNLELPSRTWFGAITLLGLVTVLVWQAALSKPDGKLHLTFLDVGTGDAILITSPTGRYLLIDGGPSSSRLSDGLGRRLPLTDRKLDYLIIGASEEEQLGALPQNLERFSPGSVLWAGQYSTSRSARQTRETLAEMGVPINTAQEGQTLDLGDGASLKVLRVCSRGAVYLVQWDRFNLLLPIGMDFDAMESLQNDDTLSSATALLLADNGYHPVNTQEWIERWNPVVTILSVGSDDWRGLPDPETLGAVQGYNLLRTDINGWIDLSTDGEELWIKVERR